MFRTGLFQIVLMYFILFYLLINHKKIPAFLKEILPFDAETVDVFLKELESMTKSNVIGAPILALSQGLAAILAFAFLDAPEPVFWGAMCGIFSFIPVVGSAIIWIPMCLIMYINGMVWQPIVIALYGALIISNIDNLIRMFIQKYFANVHPLVTILGVIVGLQLFGLPGLIFGPLLISYFILGLNIYRKSYGSNAILKA
ncbi:MAG: AI-2E family transporter [Bacteroidia bacterium]